MRRHLGSLLLLVCATGFGLLAAELGVRLFYPQQLGVWHNLRDGLVIHPPGGRIYLVDFGQQVDFNAFGMRDRERRVEKEPGVFRILLLGDSFMEALQVGLEEAFPRLLETRLRACGHRVEVLNVAVSGWGTDDQLAYLRQYGRRLGADLLLVGMTIDNDVFDNLEERFHTLNGNGLETRTTQEMGDAEYAVLRVKQYLGAHSHLTQLVRKGRHLRGMREAARELDRHALGLLLASESAHVARGWQLTYALFEAIRSWGLEAGAETGVFLIPMAMQVDGPKLDAFLARHAVPRDAVQVDRPQSLMRQFGAATRMPVIDVLPEFRDRAAGDPASLYLFDGHWSRQGHELAAGIVARELDTRGALPARGRCR